MFWRRKPGQPEPVTHTPVPAQAGWSDAPQVLVLPHHVLGDTHTAFRPSCQARVEAAVLWAGVVAAEMAIVTTLVMPALYQTSGNYTMRRESLRRMGRLLNRQGLTVLAQVHTHPGEWVGHSRYDDAHAYSQRDGALSLVWPHYGASLPHTLGGIGVHERRTGRWIQLQPDEACKRVRIVDSLTDLRWEFDQGDLDDQE